MTQFIRVRSADGPKHEYDVSPDLVAAFPDDYVVVDATPVESPREPKYVTEKATKPASSKSASKPAKPAAPAAPEPSVGETNEEGA